MTSLRQLQHEKNILIFKLDPKQKDIIKNNHKILMFTSFKTALDIVEKELNKQKIKTYIIEGSVSSKKEWN